MPERELAVVAGEEVQAEQHHRVDADLRELEEAEAAQREGQEDRDHEEQTEAPPPGAALPHGPRHAARPRVRRARWAG